MSSVHDGHPQKYCLVGDDVVVVGDGVTGAVVGDFVGSLDGAAVGAFVGDDVGEDVTGVDTGAVVGEQVNDVSHCVFVVPPPSHVPRLAGLPELGRQSLSLVQELPLVGCEVGAEHVP